jgi:hypothetical protein
MKLQHLRLYFGEHCDIDLISFNLAVQDSN